LFFGQINYNIGKGMIIMETIGSRITKARKALNMNQKELAQKAGITEASLSRYENDARDPKTSILASLAKALNVSTDYLLGVDEKKDNTLSDDEKKEIEDILDDTRRLLEQDGLMFHGMPASKEAIDSILNAMKMGMALALQQSKEQEKDKDK